MFLNILILHVLPVLAGSFTSRGMILPNTPITLPGGTPIMALTHFFLEDPKHQERQSFYIHRYTPFPIQFTQDKMFYKIYARTRYFLEKGALVFRNDQGIYLDKMAYIDLCDISFRVLESDQSNMFLSLSNILNSSELFQVHVYSMELQRLMQKQQIPVESASLFSLVFRNEEITVGFKDNKYYIDPEWLDNNHFAHYYVFNQTYNEFMTRKCVKILREEQLTQVLTNQSQYLILPDHKITGLIHEQTPLGTRHIDFYIVQDGAQMKVIFRKFDHEEGELDDIDSEEEEEREEELDIEEEEYSDEEEIDEIVEGVERLDIEEEEDLDVEEEEESQEKVEETEKENEKVEESGIEPEPELVEEIKPTPRLRKKQQPRRKTRKGKKPKSKTKRRKNKSKKVPETDPDDLINEERTLLNESIHNRTMNETIHNITLNKALNRTAPSVSPKKRIFSESFYEESKVDETKLIEEKKDSEIITKTKKVHFEDDSDPGFEPIEDEFTDNEDDLNATMPVPPKDIEPERKEPDDKLSNSAITLIVLGTLSGVVIIIFLVVYIVYRRKLRNRS